MVLAAGRQPTQRNRRQTQGTGFAGGTRVVDEEEAGEEAGEEEEADENEGHSCGVLRRGCEQPQQAAETGQAKGQRQKGPEEEGSVVAGCPPFVWEMATPAKGQEICQEHR